MKKAFLIGLLALFSFAANDSSAQVGSSLQFSQVLYVNGGTVPAGKVWKIERIVNTNSINTAQVIINGTSVGRIMDRNDGLSVTGSLTYSFSPATGGPMWLPETTVLTSESTRLMYSIIEFAVVP